MVGDEKKLLENFSFTLDQSNLVPVHLQCQILKFSTPGEIIG